MSNLNNQLTLVTCGKGNFLELEITLDSIRKFKNGFPRQVLVLSDYSEREISQIKKEFSELNLEIFQTPANGVYEAMNFGLDKVKGGHVLFLNSGDVIVSESALNKLFQACLPDRWGYGKAVITRKSGMPSTKYSFSPYIRSLHFLGLRFIPHPASILPVELIRQFGLFDLNFTVAADQKLLLQCSQTSNPIVLNELISEFHLGGLSTRSQKEIVRDFRMISQDLLPKSHFYNWPIFNPWLLVSLLRIIRAALLPQESR
jgi:hypothetical protein